MPFFIFGSRLILELLGRFPGIVIAGAARPGWIAGGLVIGDPALAAVVPAAPALHYVASAADAVSVLALARWLACRRGAAGALAKS